MAYYLDNYRQLIARVDALCNSIAASLGEQITCSSGCSSCCTSITIFPVEAAAMREAVESLPEQQAEEIYRHVAKHADNERCPLLFHHRCLLYDARPVICRTHGLPIIYTADGHRNSDCCPLNLNDTESLSGSSVVDLDKLNTLLVTVNSIYLSQSNSPESSERLTIAKVITRQLTDTHPHHPKIVQ